MTFETIDWEDEAKRVAAAFGLKGNFKFVAVSNSARQLIEKNSEGIALPEGQEVSLCCTYDKYSGRQFFVYFDTGGEVNIEKSTGINIIWDGSVVWDGVISLKGYDITVAKALFHLGLLTSEVETALQVSISNHQKLEWTVEYEARLTV